MKPAPILIVVALGILILIGVVMFLSGRSGPMEGLEPIEHASFPVLDTTESQPDPAATTSDGIEQAMFGMGCFWCSEAVFTQLKGVKSVVSGYSGGSVENPTYEQVCTGQTGHAEVIHLTYDPHVISYATLLEAFWRSHDPTTLNQQGFDHGPQYRSVIFYYSPRQQELAEMYKQKIDAAAVFPAPLVTEIVAASTFYPADGSHQDYYSRNSRKPYCRVVIRPKLEKLKSVFAGRLKED